MEERARIGIDLNIQQETLIAIIEVLLYQKVHPSLAGVEPATFGLEVQRAIHCATGTTTTTPIRF